MRLPGLDGIRAVSIALVIAYHVTSSALGRDVMHFGSFGVEIFFILSGFLITWLLCKEEAEHTSISLHAFYARRALRILPPVVIYLGVLLILSAAGFLTVSLADVTGCFFFARNIFGGSFQTAHFWSLSLEEQFYLLWPLAMILLGSNKWRLRISIVLVLASPIWHSLSYRLAGDAALVNHLRFDQMYGPILMGCCLALMRNDPKLLGYLRHSSLQAHWFALALVASVIVLWPVPHAETLTYLAVALFINYALEHEGGPLNWGPLAWVGRVSYSLYLWQQLFCWKSPLWLGHFPQNLLASMLAAVLSYYLVEQPFARLRKRVRFVPPPAWLLRFREGVASAG